MAIGFAGSICVFRWLFVPLKKSGYQLHGGDYEFIPRLMLAPIYLLAMLIVFASVICVYLPGYLAQQGTATLAVGAAGAVRETIFVMLGLVIAYIAYFNRAGTYLGATHRFIYAVLHNGAFFNATYEIAAASIVRISSLAYALDCWLLRIMKDINKGIFALAGLLNGMEDGKPSTYMMAFLLGLIFIAVMLLVI